VRDPQKVSWNGAPHCTLRRAEFSGVSRQKICGESQQDDCEIEVRENSDSHELGGAFQISYFRPVVIPFVEVEDGLKAGFASVLGLADRLHHKTQAVPGFSMPQEVSVSYQAIKSKVYRLIDALVVGEKSEAEVQDSIRRWWTLIHPADRPIAQKYLMAVLGRSACALEAIGDVLAVAGGAHTVIPELSSKSMKVLERVVKETTYRTAI
jgi:hypothetical protein